MNDSSLSAAARTPRPQAGYVAEALKALIQTQVPIKEIHIASGEPLNYRSPAGYRILNEARVVGDEDIHQLMGFAADGRYDPMKRMLEAKHVCAATSTRKADASRLPFAVFPPRRGPTSPWAGPCNLPMSSIAIRVVSSS